MARCHWSLRTSLAESQTAPFESTHHKRDVESFDTRTLNSDFKNVWERCHSARWMKPLRRWMPQASKPATAATMTIIPRTVIRSRGIRIPVASCKF